MRTIKQQIGYGLTPSSEDRKKATTMIYVQSGDEYIGVEIVGTAAILADDYVYLSVARPVSVIGKIDGTTAKVIEDNDERGMAMLKIDLKDYIDRPTTRNRVLPVAPPDVESIFGDKIKEFEKQNPGYTLDWVNGAPKTKKIRAPKNP